jgi:hypothetical protein
MHECLLAYVRIHASAFIRQPLGKYLACLPKPMACASSRQQLLLWRIGLTRKTNMLTHAMVKQAWPDVLVYQPQNLPHKHNLGKCCRKSVTLATVCKLYLE